MFYMNFEKAAASFSASFKELPPWIQLSLVIVLVPALTLAGTLLENKITKNDR